MEQVRDARLDSLCESLGETRDRMNDLRADESSDLGAALKRMREKGLTTYRHAGMELARVPGEEKLRCRRTSQGASAENQEDQEADPGLEQLDQADLDGNGDATELEG